MSSSQSAEGAGLPLAPDTSNLSTLFAYSMRQQNLRHRKAIPAKIEAVLSDSYVDVRPGNLARYKGDTTPVALPIIPQVPVLMPQGASYSIRLPIKVGDTGLLIVADRALGPWMSGNGDPTDPADMRAHDLTDAIFLPGLVPDAVSANKSPVDGDIVIQNGLAELHIQPAGTFKLTNGSEELVELVQETISALNALGTAVTSLTAGAVASPAGTIVFTPNALSALTAAIGRVGPIATRLATLKGL